MQTALYHPELGYYAVASPGIGRAGDFMTSPEVSSLFGSMLARHVVEIWRAAGAPAEWTVVELGGGTGAMAADIHAALEADEPDLLAGLVYVIVESSPTLRLRQQLKLRRYPQVKWVESPDELGVVEQGHVISNEFFDALPVHRITIAEGKLLELCVGLDGDEFVDSPGQPSTPEIAEYFRLAGVAPAEGNIAEVNLLAPRLTGDIAGRLKRGVITTLDFGYPAEELYASWRRQGTLLCFYRHAASDDPYRRVGKQDITAHVDFSALARTAEAQGFAVRKLASQMEFLSGLGIVAAAQAPGLPLEEQAARRRALHELIDPAGLGRIRVQIALKGLVLA